MQPGGNVLVHGCVFTHRLGVHVPEPGEGRGQPGGPGNGVLRRGAGSQRTGPPEGRLVVEHHSTSQPPGHGESLATLPGAGPASSRPGLTRFRRGARGDHGNRVTLPRGARDITGVPLGRHPPVATEEQCRAALQRLLARLDGGGGSGLDRTVSASVTDLGVTFATRLRNGRAEEITSGPADDADKAQIRLAASSDDLLALTDGALPLPAAWASGRLKVEASVLDLMKLRSLL